MLSFAHFILIVFFLPCFTQTHSRSFGLPLNPTLIVHFFFSHSYSYKFQSRQSFPLLTTASTHLTPPIIHPLKASSSSAFTTCIKLSPSTPSRSSSPVRRTDRVQFWLAIGIRVHSFSCSVSLFLSLFLALSKKFLLFSFLFFCLLLVG